MPLTRAFRDTVMARAEADPAFRAGLYAEAVQSMLDGDYVTGRSLLRQFINATIGFTGLADAVNISEKSLMRMFGETGNPTAENLVRVLRALKDDSHLSLTVQASHRMRAPQSMSQRTGKTQAKPAIP